MVNRCNMRRKIGTDRRSAVLSVIISPKYESTCNLHEEGSIYTTHRTFYVQPVVYRKPFDTHYKTPCVKSPGWLEMNKFCSYSSTKENLKIINSLLAQKTSRQHLKQSMSRIQIILIARM